jgi:hypothetical protein
MHGICDGNPCDIVPNCPTRQHGCGWHLG